MTTTAAYNANEVAAVYMSLDREDLLSSDEGGAKLDSSTSLKNGFYALSDPLNLRGVLESFEADFSRGSDSSTYRVRILNPTTELETVLLGFYNNLFPSGKSTFDSFKDASEKDKRMNKVEDLKDKRMDRVEELTGDRDTAYLSNNEPPQLPRVYLRFGYGTDEQSGLSRIHKAVVSDIKYIVTTGKDKVIELQCTDLYTFSKQNTSFNKRPYVSRVSVGDTINGQPSLRKPSEIMTDLFASYTSVYPGCVPIIDLGEYTDPIDNLVYSVAYSLAESDKLTKEKKKAAKEEGNETSGVTDVAVDSTGQLTVGEIKAIEDMLNRPLTSDKSIDRGARGVVTPQILFQAFKLVFEQLGLVWELNPIDSPDSINGPIAPLQNSPLNSGKDTNAAQTSKYTLNQSNTKVVSDQKVNIKTEFLDIPYLAHNTEVFNRNTNMLSFWPMGLEIPPTIDAGQVPGLVLGTIKNIYGVGGLNVTKSWNGVAPTDCATYDSATHTKGCGTGTAPTEPSQTTQLEFGTVVEFVETASQIRTKTNPITRSYFLDETSRFVLNPPSITPVGDGYDIPTSTWHPPQWYAPGNSTPSVQNNTPIKVKFMNIEGSVELNEREFYLYETDSQPTNGSKFFLLESVPGLDGTVDLTWHNQQYDEEVSPYESGGEIWDPTVELQPNIPSEASRKVRPLTTEEKVLARDAGVAPLWVDAGMVNPNNYVQGAIKGEDPNFKYVFTLGELSGKFDLGEVVAADVALNSVLNPDFVDSSYIKPIPVSIPVVTPDNPDIKFFTGPQANTNEINIPSQVPLLDLSRMQLYSATSWELMPPGEFKNWARYATGVLNPSINMEPSVIPEMADNPPLVYLEPTSDTASWGLQCAVNYNKILKDAQERAAAAAAAALKEMDDAAALEANPPPETITTNPGKWAEKVSKHSNAYVSMGDGSQAPHISRFLETIINNINRLIIGKSSKMMVQPIQVNSLSEEDRVKLSSKAKGLEGVTWDEPWADKDSVILVVGPSDEIKAQYADPIIRPILSFPTAATNPDFIDNPEAAAKIIWLDYGNPNSIVAKADFTGDIRVLVNLAQSNYAARQWNDVKQLFDGETTLSKNVVTNVISMGLANRISELTTKSATNNQGLNEEEEASLASLKKHQNNLVSTTESDSGEITAGSSDAVIDKELLSIFPELVASFSTDEDLNEILGENSAKEMRILASLISNPKTLNWMFPEAVIDGNTNAKTTQVITVTGGSVVKNDVTVKILQRKIDFADIRTRISDLDTQNKLSDVSFNFQTAMSQESFTLKLTTLGIPEIDNPSQEFLSRLVFFKFFDPRLASGQLHWLSGVYRISGFKHMIAPSQGFLTELSLYRDPAYNISSARDTR